MALVSYFMILNQFTQLPNKRQIDTKQRLYIVQALTIQYASGKSAADHNQRSEHNE